MNKTRAWGFAVGVMIAWSIGLGVVATRLGEANRGHSTFAAVGHSRSDSARGHLVR